MDYNRGDCYRGSGDAEMAVRDYTRALEVEPSNWMVKTRLSMAHYLKVKSAVYASETACKKFHTLSLVLITRFPKDFSTVWYGVYSGQYRFQYPADSIVLKVQWELVLLR